MKFSTQLILIIISNTSLTASLYYDCDTINKSIVYENFEFLQAYSLTIDKFKRLDEIKFNCSQTFQLMILQIIPDNFLILDNSLDLSGLLIDSPSFSLHFSNLKGVDILTDSRFNLDRTHLEYDFYIDISYSHFIFYKNSVLFDSALCLEHARSEQSSTNFFTHTTDVVLRNYVFFSKQMCPYLFDDSSMHSLGLGFLSDTLLNRNQFEFIESDETELAKIQAKDLKIFYVTLMHEKLTAKTLNKHVFRNLFSLSVVDQLVSIEDELFKNFNDLYRISLRLYNFKQFYHQGNKWFDYIRYSMEDSEVTKMNKISSDALLNILLNHNNDTTFNSVYTYEDEDFCLFARFPHAKLVYPIVDPAEMINCSCTILWLLQHTWRYYDVSPNDPYYGNDFLNFVSFGELYLSLSSCVSNREFKRNYDRCNFSGRFKLCDKAEFAVKNKPG